jgi:uncharacterized protein
MTILNDKFELLKSNILSYESFAVAYSGGVDSTFLLKVAHMALGDKAVAVTGKSASFPKREFDASASFTSANNIKQIPFISEELDIEGFSNNPINRCYLCKTELFTKIKIIAKENGLKYVLEGSNMDDNGDYRPGLEAVKELRIKSPLRNAGLNKSEIRQLSKEQGLSTWNKPSFACLSSRFPYGEEINVEKLIMVDLAEVCLLELGFTQVRVRHHGNLARIEIQEEDFYKTIDQNIRLKIIS